MTFYRIQRWVAATLLIALLIGAVAVPTASHRHAGVQGGHSHGIRSTLQHPLSDRAAGCTSPAQPREEAATSHNPEFQDISLDALRDELVFGPAQASTSDQALVDADVRQPTDQETHDESIPHMHVNLLGFEITINLPSDSTAPPAALGIANSVEHSTNLTFGDDQVRLAALRVAIMRPESGKPFSHSVPVFLFSRCDRLASVRPIITFGIPVDESWPSSTILIDSPPPRMG